MPRFNLDSFNYNPLTNRSNAAIDSAMRNVDAADARMWERRSSNPKPQSRKSTKRRGAGYRKRNVQQPKPVVGDSVTVQAGDSLSAILKRTTGSYKNVAEVAKLNGIKDPNKIYVGQKIKIPGYKADVADKPAADSAKPADVKPAAVAAATSVVKDSVAAPKDTTTIVRNDSIPAAPRDSIATTVPADTTSESGYERARAHAMQLLREREARKQRELQQQNVGKHNGSVRIPKANVLADSGETGRELRGERADRLIEKGLNYGSNSAEADASFLQLISGGIPVNILNREFRAIRAFIKGHDVPTSTIISKLGPYGSKRSINRYNKSVADRIEKLVKGSKSKPTSNSTGASKSSSTNQDIPVVIANNKKPYNPPLSTVKPKPNPKREYVRPRTTNIKPRQTRSVNTHVGVSTVKPKASTPTRVNTRRWSGTSGWNRTSGWGQPGKGGWKTQPTSVTKPKAEPKPVDIKPNSTANKKWKPTSQHKQARGWQHVNRRR